MNVETIKKKLEDMGYRPSLDKDGDIAFMFQMKQLYLITQSIEEDSYAVLYYPNLKDIEEGDEILALTACNKCTRETRLVKFFFDFELKAVSITCEFFFTDDSIDFIIPKVLRLIGIARTTFLNKMRELVNAAKSDDDESGEEDGGEDGIFDCDAEELDDDTDTNDNENNSDNENEI